MKAKLLRRIRYTYLKLTCNHDLIFVRNIHGDEIILTGYKRSVWKCSKCGKYKFKDHLYYADESLQN